MNMTDAHRAPDFFIFQRGTFTPLQDFLRSIFTPSSSD